jgi:hypothetical protein
MGSFSTIAVNCMFWFDVDGLTFGMDVVIHFPTYIGITRIMKILDTDYADIR